VIVYTYACPVCGRMVLSEKPNQRNFCDREHEAAPTEMRPTGMVSLEGWMQRMATSNPPQLPDLQHLEPEQG
jgi:hypothetical protein